MHTSDSSIVLATQQLTQDDLATVMYTSDSTTVLATQQFEHKTIQRVYCTLAIRVWCLQRSNIFPTTAPTHQQLLSTWTVVRLISTMENSRAANPTYGAKLNIIAPVFFATTSGSFGAVETAVKDVMEVFRP